MRSSTRRQRKTSHRIPRKSKPRLEPLEQRWLLSAEPAGQEAIISLEGSFVQGRPDVAIDGNGNYVVAWVGSNTPADGLGVLVQGFNANGTPRTNQVRVNTTPWDSANRPRVAIDATGDYVVTWDSFAANGYDVFARRFAPNGFPRGNEFVVNSSPSGNQSAPAVSMADDGSFAVTWLNSSGGSQIQVRRFDPLGQPLSSDTNVNTLQTGTRAVPDIAMNASGEFAVAWQSLGQDGSGSGVFARKYSAEGAAQGGEIAVNTTTNGDQRAPRLAMDSDGDFIVAWESSGQDGSGFGVYSRRFDSLGIPQGAEQRANSTTRGDQRAPDVAVGTDGDYAVVWQGESPDNSDFDIYLQQYAADGTADGDEELVNTKLEGDQTAPVISINPAGDFAVVWESFGQFTQVEDIRSQLFRATSGEDGDPFEPNNNFINATDLGVVDSRVVSDAKITNFFDDDIYQLTPSVSGTLNVDLLFSDADGNLELAILDAEQNFLDRSIGDTDSERVSVRVDQGETYFVFVDATTVTRSTDYELRLEVTQAPPDGDRFESNNSFETAASLGSIGSLAESGLSLHRPGDEDYYTFTANGSGTMQISLDFQHEIANLNLAIFDAAQVRLAESESFSNAERVAINVVQGAQYFVEVNSPAFESTPSYGLTFNLLTGNFGDFFESNNSIDSATDLGEVQIYREDGLSVHAPGDFDFFTFTVPTDGQIRVEIEFSQQEGDLDLFLLSGPRTTIAESQTNDDNEVVTANVLAGTTYIVIVSGHGFATNENYNLFLELGDGFVGDRFEPNNAFGQPTNLGITDRFEATDLTIDASSDVDYFALTAPINGTLDVEVLFEHAIGNLEVIVLNANQQLMAVGLTESDNENISVRVVQGQTYFIRVEGSEVDAEVPYGIVAVVREGAPLGDRFEPNNSFNTATNFVVVTERAEPGLSFHSAETDDYFTFIAGASGVLTVDVTFSHAQGDVDAFLLDSGPNLLVAGQTETDNERLITNVIQGRQYFLVITNPGDAINPEYDLALRIADSTAPPTLNPITDQTGIVEGSGAQVIGLTGIGGGGPNSTLEITAVSDNPGLIPNPGVVYTSPSPTGSLLFQPLPGATGTATISVTVTVAENGLSTTQEFTVTVVPRQIPGDVNGDQRVDLIDFATLKENFGGAGGLAQGDFNGDGQIDLADFTILKDNFGFDIADPPVEAAFSQPDSESRLLEAVERLFGHAEE